MHYQIKALYLSVKSLKLINAKPGWGKSGTGTGNSRVKSGRGPGQEVLNENIYAVVWPNNLQPAEMELVSRCNFKTFHDHQ